MNCKKCSICGANWINDQLYWSGTQKKAMEIDLAGLVCNNLPSEKISGCINPKRGETGGDTWQKRLDFIDNQMDKILNN